MPKIDLTVTVSVIIALCAIIVPLLTTALNNHHQYKMKKLELKDNEIKNNLKYQRSIYENYLKSTGQCLTHMNTDSLRLYGESYPLALLYFPKELTDSLIGINGAIISRNPLSSDIDSFNKIVLQLTSTLKIL